MKRFLLTSALLLSVSSCNSDKIESTHIEKIERFAIQVSTNPIGGDEQSNLETDWGVLILPIGYSKENSNKTRLVIYCHSGGGTVTDKTSEAESVDIVQYLVSQGYAVMSMQGMPATYAERLHIDLCRTVGSHISLRSIKIGYRYILRKYNIARDGCFVFSNSNGGLMASNIVTLTKIPVLAQAGLAPLLSIERNVWNIQSGTLSNGFKSYQNRANVIRIYGMNPISTQDDLNNSVYEKDKVGIYDPFDYCLHQTKQPYRTPYLIFTMKQDGVVLHSIAQEFTTKLNDRGSNIILSDIEEYGGHNVPASPVITGNFTYMNIDLKLRQTVEEIGKFFNSYNPDLNGSRQ